MRIWRALRNLQVLERGQLLVMLAIMLPVVVGAMGLSIDIGYSMWARTDQQKTADAAALAGADYLLTNGPTGSSVTAQATTYAQKNGYNSPGATVTVNNPAVTCPSGSTHADC